jgi:hypothetical protein
MEIKNKQAVQTFCIMWFHSIFLNTYWDFNLFFAKLKKQSESEYFLYYLHGVLYKNGCLVKIIHFLLHIL